MSRIHPLAALAPLLCAVAPIAHAGTLGVPVLITNDADSGIAMDLTYTHALDLGNGGGTTINGVSFTAGNAGSGGGGARDGYLGWWSSAPNAHAGNANTGVAPGSGIGNLLTDMRYGGSPASLRFTGLTPGTTYSTRIYYRQWGAGFNREHDLSFSEDGGNAFVSVATIDQDSTNAAYYVDYTYTAQPSPLGGAYPLEVLFAQTANTGAGGTWHLYGASNHVVAGTQATPEMLGVVTSDNHYALYLGQADGSNLRAIGRDNLGDWQQAEAHSMSYMPGDHIYIVSWDNPGAVADPQMVVGNFDLPGGGVLGTNAVDWEVAEGPAGMNPGNNLDLGAIPSTGDLASVIETATFGAIGASAANSSGPWGPNAVFSADFSGTPGEFIWIDTLDNLSITNTNESYAVFRSINPIVPIPEPSTVVLLCAAGASLLFPSRRRS